MINVYIASHCRWAAMHFAEVLNESTFVDIVSGWHYKEFKPIEEHTLEERIEIAFEDAKQVAECHVLVLVAGPDKYSGGKFVEVGIALGMGKKIIVVGRRENALMYHPLIMQVDTPHKAEQLLWKLFE